ncbi:flagellar brake protein [Paraburkholderia phymatum]|uniref:Type IV pilus assembly PilZ n=1 Tax=Paraburkholderia phymatum (strain DSM 17167 / CIP 108236 / LMG 21445 / STM815) TaxID=391038 RepID=B2JRI8_PARP8|nr:flagellar brake protein [Paraburkholderia phymatum]ACC72315.1 type IV pilus assembly PilZ [Paraburkholderia phymatum STM815]
MQTSEDTVQTGASAPVLSRQLAPDAVPVGEPLAFPVVDSDGMLLFDRGAVVIGAEEHRFLFQHFKPQRGDLSEVPQDGAAAPLSTAKQQADADSLALKDMHLTIGALIGVRSQVGMGAPMHPSRIIGFAPNESLFVTPPLVDGKAMQLAVGENIEIVAIASQAVFRFVCTVDSVCLVPFHYLVLSKPGAVRRLRERKSVRVRANLPLRFGIDANGTGYESLGLVQSVSAMGMSFAAPWTVGEVGKRIRVAFALRSKDLETSIETTAIIRNVQAGSSPGDPITHGIEFEKLDQVEQMALKVYVFDRIDDVIFWTSGPK